MWLGSKGKQIWRETFCYIPDTSPPTTITHTRLHTPFLHTRMVMKDSYVCLLSHPVALEKIKKTCKVHTQTHTQSVLGSQWGEIDILTLVSWMAGFMYDIALYNRHCNTVIEQLINYHFKLTAINLFWGFQQCCSALIHQHHPLFFSSLTSPSVFMGCFMVPLVSWLVEVPPLYTIFAWIITTPT